MQLGKQKQEIQTEKKNRDRKCMLEGARREKSDSGRDYF